MLKYELIRMVEVSDWDELVQDTYGRIYNFQQQDGCKSRGIFNLNIPSEWSEDYDNDTIVEKVNGPEEGVSFKGWLERDPDQPLKDERDNLSYHISMFYERNFYPEVNTVANDLYAKGLIEAGNYTINIDW